MATTTTADSEDLTVLTQWVLDTYPETRVLSIATFRRFLDELYCLMIEAGLLNFKHFTMQETLDLPEHGVILDGLMTQLQHIPV